MRICDILHKKHSVSFEVFPPRKEIESDLKAIYATIARLSSFRPDFISVTCQTVGRNRERALEIADFIHCAGMTVMSHVTAAGYHKEDVDSLLSDLECRGVENILALRGDIAPGMQFPTSPWRDFRYASDLIAYINRTANFCVGAACYPEGHPECHSFTLDIQYLKIKQDAGADFFVSQVFFDTDAFFVFLDRIRAAGISIPVIAGIMPVLNARQIGRIVDLCACSVPNDLSRMLERYREDDESMRQAGIDYAAAQVERLVKGGTNGIHIYTMNKPIEAIDVLNKGLGKGVAV